MKKRLDLTVRTSPQFVTRIVERPGQWMADADIARLQSDLHSVARKALPAASLEYGVFSGNRAVLERTVVTIVYRNTDGEAVAFNAMPIIPVSLSGKAEDVLHLGLVMIDRDVRSQGLSWVLYGLTCFLIFLKNQFRPLWISNVTQVPAVAGMVAEIFSGVYPSPRPDTRRTLRHQLIAREIMAQHRGAFGVGMEAEFDADRFVIANAYTGGSDNLKKTFDEAPKHRKQEYNEFCANELDYIRGDDLLQVGMIDLNAARRFLTESVPRNAIGRLALAAFVVFCQRLALPLLYWADATRPWSILRPARRW